MALGTTLQRTSTHLTGEANREVRIQFNKLAADVDLLRTTVAAMITAAATSLPAVAGVVTPAPVTAVKVADNNGNTTF